MADKLPDEVLEAGHASDEVAHRVDLVPEGLELAHLQEVVHVLEKSSNGLLRLRNRLLSRIILHLDVFNDGLFQVFLREKCLATNEVRVRKVGQSLQQNPDHHLKLK